MSMHKLMEVLAKNVKVIQPYGNYVTIKLFKPEETSQGGIVLPDQVLENDKQMLALVMSVGPGMRGLMDGKPIGTFTEEGDLILVLKHAPVEIKLGGHTAHIIGEGDILGKLDKVALKKLLKPREIKKLPKEIQEVL